MVLPMLTNEACILESRFASEMLPERSCWIISHFQSGVARPADLCINHPNVSRSHVLISQDEEGYFVRDVGSRHGSSSTELVLVT